MNYTMFIAVYILFLISKVMTISALPNELTTRQGVIKFTYDTGTSLY